MKVDFTNAELKYLRLIADATAERIEYNDTLFRINDVPQTAIDELEKNAAILSRIIAKLEATKKRVN